MALGLNFAPTAQNQQEQNKPAGTPIQDAIKILSLRIPSFVGAQGIAPNALLQGGGAQNFPFGGQTPGGLDEFLRRLFGGSGFGGGMAGSPGGVAGMAPGMPPMGGPPAPNVRPGEESNRVPTPAPQAPMPMPGPPVERMPGFSPSPQMSPQPMERPLPTFGQGRQPFLQQR